MGHEDHAPASRADVAYETFYSGAIGGAVPAIYFLVTDILAGQPLLTPSVLGNVMFFGAEPGAVEGVDLTAVALYSMVHFATFGVLGLVATRLVRTVEKRSGGGFVLPALVLYLLVAGGFWAGDMTVMPGVVDALGQGNVLLSGALTAVVMTWFLRYAHGTAEPNATKEGAAAPV